MGHIQDGEGGMRKGFRLKDLLRMWQIKPGMVLGYAIFAGPPEYGHVLWFSGDPYDEDDIKYILSVINNNPLKHDLWRVIRLDSAIFQKKRAVKIAKVLAFKLIVSNDYYYLICGREGIIERVTYDPDGTFPLIAVVR